jgi:hypothetical protein
MVGLAGLTAMCIAVTVYAAGGTKRTSETCANDGECDKGHCYTKKNGDKVCVDCSPDTIARTRDLTDKWCKDASNFPRKCDNIPQTQEASEAYFKLRIANNDQCISIRKDENSACWNGADQGHRDRSTKPSAAGRTATTNLIRATEMEASTHAPTRLTHQRPPPLKAHADLGGKDVKIGQKTTRSSTAGKSRMLSRTPTTASSRFSVSIATVCRA